MPSVAADAAKAARALWTEYRESRAVHLRNQLIERNYPLVVQQAEQVHRTLPKNAVDMDDLVQAGVFGLVCSIEAFDPDRGVNFSTYASRRIRGCILDSLRDADWVPRLVRARQAAFTRASAALVVELGRSPTDEEIRHRLGVSPAKYELMRPDGADPLPRSRSLSWPMFVEEETGKTAELLESLPNADVDLPGLDLEQREELLKTLRGFTPAEQLVVRLYDLGGMKMKEVARTIGVSESRVSQMHANILQRLKARLTVSADL